MLLAVVNGEMGQAQSGTDIVDWHNNDLKALTHALISATLVAQQNSGKGLDEVLDKHHQLSARLKAELLAPLTVINLYHQLIVKNPDKKQSYLGVIEQQIVRFGELTEDVVNIYGLLYDMLVLSEDEQAAD